MDQNVTDAVIAAARGANIAPAALLAVVEIESGGQALESDGKTPRLLFERHVFHRELARRAPGKLAAAKAAGLAIPKWSKSTQYKDQGSSAARLRLLARARAVDEECANRSCSWGLGQTMGFLAEELGMPSATEMVARMTAGGIRIQVQMMVDEIARKRLIDKLERGDWAGFAKVYNGPGYKQNAYDTKLASAHRRWLAKLAAPASVAPPESAVPAPASIQSEEVIKSVQRRLRELGYADVGNVDGELGPRTRGGILAFRSDAHLPLTPVVDPELLVALAGATAREIPDTRAQAPATLVAEKIPLAKAARTSALWARAQAIGAAVLAALMGAADKLGEATDKLAPVKDFLGAVPVWAWVLGLAGVSLALWRASRRTEAEAVQAYRDARIM